MLGDKNQMGTKKIIKHFMDKKIVGTMIISIKIVMDYYIFQSP